MKRFSYAILIISDRGARGDREDATAPLIHALVQPIGGQPADCLVVPDEVADIQAALRQWCDERLIDLIITTGGTGLYPRDLTPEATAPLLHRQIPGMAEAMRAASLAKTPHGMLSRGLVGIRGRSLIVNLPGSPQGAKENLEAILPALPHALAKIQGDPSECAR